VNGVRVTDLLVGLELVGVDRGRFVSDHGIQERGDLALAVAFGFAKPKQEFLGKTSVGAHVFLGGSGWGLISFE
jgi:hypothetical protein